MNAYELLNIDDQLYEKLKNIGEYSINSIVKTRAKRNLDEAILGINKIFDDSDSMEIKLQQIQEKISEAYLHVIAYEQIGNEKARKEYDKRGRTDIQAMQSDRENRLKNAAIIRINGKELNAFQILGVSNEKARDEISEEDRVETLRKQDENIRTKTFAAARMAIQGSKLTDIESIKRMMLTTTKYLWAYSKTKSPSLREIYRYQQLAYKGDKAARSLGKPQVLPLQEQPFVYIEMEDDEVYDHMILSKVAVLQSHAFVAEQHGYGYTVSKFRKDEKVEDSEIFSNIDISRMKKDSNYSERVKESLLSSYNIKIGQRILGGYIGELDESGKVKFDLDAIGISRAYWREKSREMHSNTKKQNTAKDNEAPEHGDESSR